MNQLKLMNAHLDCLEQDIKMTCKVCNCDIKKHITILIQTEKNVLQHFTLHLKRKCIKFLLKEYHIYNDDIITYARFSDGKEYKLYFCGKEMFDFPVEEDISSIKNLKFKDIFELIKHFKIPYDDNDWRSVVQICCFPVRITDLSFFLVCLIPAILMILHHMFF